MNVFGVSLGTFVPPLSLHAPRNAEISKNLSSRRRDARSLKTNGDEKSREVRHGSGHGKSLLDGEMLVLAR